MKFSVFAILAVIGVIIWRAYQRMKEAAIAGTQRKGTLGANSDNDWVTNNPSPWQTSCTNTLPVSTGITPIPMPMQIKPGVIQNPATVFGGGPVHNITELTGSPRATLLQ